MADSFLLPNGVEKESLVCAPNLIVTLSVANVGTESGPAAALVRHLYYRPVTQEDNTEMNVTRYGSEDSENPESLQVVGDHHSAYPAADRGDFRFRGSSPT